MAGIRSLSLPFPIPYPIRLSLFAIRYVALSGGHNDGHDGTAFLWAVKGAGAVAGSAVSLAYILPSGRREAALRFAVGVVCGLVFGGTAGVKIAAELGIAAALGAPRDDADGSGGRQPLGLVGARPRPEGADCRQRRGTAPGEPMAGSRGHDQGRGRVEARRRPFRAMPACSGGSTSARTWSSAVPSPTRCGGAAPAASACCSSTTPSQPIGVWTEIREDRARAVCARPAVDKDVGRAREVLA